MSSSRRIFLRRGSFLVGAFAASPVAVGMAVPGSMPSGLGSLRVWAGRFAESMELRGGGVAALASGATPKALTVLVRVRDRAALTAAWQSLPFQEVHVAGSELCFQIGGVFYRVRCFEGDEYAEELKRAPGFAHEALSQAAAGGPVSDPLGALALGGAVLRPARTWSDPSEKFDAVLQGLVEQGRFGLRATPQFELLRLKTLRRRPASAAEAAAVAGSVAATLAPLAGGLNESSIVSLLHSPLVDQALAQHFSRSGRLVTADFQRLKSSPRAPYDEPGAVWLAALFGEARLQGAARPAVEDTDRLAALHTRRALTRAREMVSQSRPPA